MAYLQLFQRGVDVGGRKEDIAGAFCYTRSTCDDERELLALSHRYRASGEDRCHPEMLRDSVTAQRYAPSSKDDIIGTDVVTDECKLLTEQWVQLFGARFRVCRQKEWLALVSKNTAQRTAKKLRIHHTAGLECLMTSEQLDGHNTIVGNTGAQSQGQKII